MMIKASIVGTLSSLSSPDLCPDLIVGFFNMTRSKAEDYAAILLGFFSGFDWTGFCANISTNLQMECNWLNRWVEIDKNNGKLRMAPWVRIPLSPPLFRFSH